MTLCVGEYISMLQRRGLYRSATLELMTTWMTFHTFCPISAQQGPDEKITQLHSSSKNPIYPWHFEKSITESCQEVPSSCFTHTDYTGKVNFRQVWLFQGTLRATG